MKFFFLLFLSISGCAVSDSSQAVEEHPSLICMITSNTRDWVMGEKVEITYTLQNKSRVPVKIAKSIVGDDAIWFRLCITDARSDTIISGLENRFIITDDLLQLITCDLLPNEIIEVTDSLMPDNIRGWRNIDLKPGKYMVSVFYRFEPEKEPDAAGLYMGEAEEYHLWTGVIKSAPLDIIVTEK